MQLSHGLMFHTELLIRLMMNFISNHWYFYAKPDETVTASDDLFDMHINMGNDSTGCGDVLTDNSKENGPVYHTRGTGGIRDDIWQSTCFQCKNTCWKL